MELDFSLLADYVPIIIIVVAACAAFISGCIIAYAVSRFRGVKTVREDYRYTIEVPSGNTVFSCDRPSIDMIELVDGDGLFPMGTRAMWEVPSLERQVKTAKQLKYVKSVNDTLTGAEISLGSFGDYSVEIAKKPKARRRDTKYAYSNPFIASNSYTLCLGTSESLYKKCMINGNLVDCLRIIQEVLKSSDDGRTFRKWYDCK